MTESARYVKWVEWSDEDECFVGQCPGIIGPCCHGDDEVAVYSELCQFVDEWIEIFKSDGPFAKLGTADIATKGREVRREPISSGRQGAPER